MRLIDADALIESIKRQCAFCRLMPDKEIQQLADVMEKGLVEEVENAPTIKSIEWIPCSERLPARQGYYICACKDGSRVLKTTTIKWSNGWQLSGTRAYWKVIAWMPLPEPMKGADDE